MATTPTTAPATTTGRHTQVRDGKSLGFRDGDAWVTHYTGISDMVRDCRDSVRERPDLMVFDLNDGGWIGRQFRDWDHVVAEVEGTWKEGVDRIEAIAAELGREDLPRPTVLRRTRVWDDYAGDEVDVDRWRAADPFYRTNTPVRRVGPQVVTLLSAIGQNAHRSSESLFWRGAVSVVLARMLEDAGYRAEIVGFGQTERTYISGPAPHAMISVDLKGAGDSLDVGALANALSGWYFRTVYFGSFLAPRQRTCGSLGRMIEPTPQAVEYLTSTRGVARPWLVSGVYDRTSALALARKLLSELAGN